MDYRNDFVRRQDRLLDRDVAVQLLQGGEYGVLSLVGFDGAYGVPLNYVWDGQRSIYIHCAPRGEKLECLKANPNVSFVVVGLTQVLPEKFTTAYQSVIVKGEICSVDDLAEKTKALELILDKYSPHHKVQGMVYAQKSLARTAILRLDIKTMSGKSKPLPTVSQIG